MEQPRPRSAGRAAEATPAATPPALPRQQAEGGSVEGRRRGGKAEVGRRPASTTAGGRSAETDEAAAGGSAAELGPDELEEAVSLLSYTVRKKKAEGGGGKQNADPEWDGVFAP